MYGCSLSIDNLNILALISNCKIVIFNLLYKWLNLFYLISNRNLFLSNYHIANSFKFNFQATNSFYQFSNQYSTLPGLIRGQTAVKKIQRQKKIRILIENSEEATFKNISQELRMLSSSLSDCQSQTLIVKFLNLSGIVNCVTKSLNHEITLNLSV